MQQAQHGLLELLRIGENHREAKLYRAVSHGVDDVLARHRADAAVLKAPHV